MRLSPTSPGSRLGAVLECRLGAGGRAPMIAFLPWPGSLTSGPRRGTGGTGPPRKTADRDSPPPSWPLGKPGGGTRGVTSTLTPTDLPLRPGHGDHLEVAVAALGEC